MATRGVLKKVWDNEKNWGLVIDVDEHGEHKLNLWKWELAGKPSDNHPEPICDCHEWVGQRIVYTATKGRLKDKDGPDDGDRWPASVEEISLESDMNAVFEQMDAERAEKPSEPQQQPEDVEPVHKQPTPND